MGYLVALVIIGFSVLVGINTIPLWGHWLSIGTKIQIAEPGQDWLTMAREGKSSKTKTPWWMWIMIGMGAIFFVGGGLMLLFL